MLKITYVYDPLCGWCYGFSPVIKKLYKKFRSKLDFEVISGGMVVGDRIGPIGEVAAYISEAYKVVENRTGVEFGKDFLKVLEEGSMIFSSIPPSQALTAFKQMRTNDAVLMAHEIQKTIYYDGNAPVNPNGYFELAEKFELNLAEYKSLLQSDQIAQATQAEFKKSAELGVSGFPTVFIGTEDQMIPISRGYQDYEEFLMNVINGASYFDVDIMS